MKKFSKVLCLVLVLAMMAGLCCFGTNAAYADADKITYKEAADVMSAVGVFEGDANGFRPQDTLTRAEAAKLIAYLDGAGTYTGTCGYTDCKGHWASNFIAYCTVVGYVEGVGNGKFGPNDTLTGYQFAKMLFGALGYQAKAEGMTGAAWEVAVAKFIKATGLTTGITGFNGVLNVTREQAAQMCLNALKATCVDYTGGSTISVNGIEITTGAQIRNLPTTGYVGVSALGDSTTVQLGEKLYGGNLVMDTSISGLTTWTYKPLRSTTNSSGKIGTYAVSANMTYVVTSSDVLALTLAGDKAEAVALAAAQKQAGNAFLKLASTGAAVVSVNGGTAQAITSTTFQAGDALAIYLSATDSDLITKVAVTRESAAQIVNVTANTGKATTDVLNTVGKVVYNYNVFIDTDFDGVYNIKTNDLVLPGFDAATYVKGALLSVVLKDASTILSSEIATTATGAITRYSAAKTTVEGTDYVWANAGIPTPAAIDYKTPGSYTLVLNKAGYVTAIVEVSAKHIDLTDVAYIMSTPWVESSKAYGLTNNTVYVQVMYLDGTIKDVAIGGFPGTYVDAFTTNAAGYGAAATATTVDAIGSAFGGKLAVLTAVPAVGTTPAYTALDVATAATKIDVKNGAGDYVNNYAFVNAATALGMSGLNTYFGTYGFLTSDTKVVLLNTKTSSAVAKATVFTGAVSYTPAASEDMYVITNTTAKGTEVVAVIYTGTTKTTTSTDLFYVNAPIVNGYSSLGVYQTVYTMDGTATEILVAAPVAQGFYSYTKTANDVYVLTPFVGATILPYPAAAWTLGGIGAYTDVQYVPNYYGTSAINLKDRIAGLNSIPAASVKVVDLRKPADVALFNVALDSVEMLAAASIEKNIECSVYVGLNGATVIFVTGYVDQTAATYTTVAGAYGTSVTGVAAGTAIAYTDPVIGFKLATGDTTAAQVSLTLTKLGADGWTFTQNYTNKNKLAYSTLPSEAFDYDSGSATHIMGFGGFNFELTVDGVTYYGSFTTDSTGAVSFN